MLNIYQPTLPDNLSQLKRREVIIKEERYMVPAHIVRIDDRMKGWQVKYNKRTKFFSDGPRKGLTIKESLDQAISFLSDELKVPK